MVFCRSKAQAIRNCNAVIYKLIHSGVHEYTCDICKETFSRRCNAVVVNSHRRDIPVSM